MTGEPPSETPRDRRRRLLSLSRRTLFFGLVCAAALIGTSTLAGAASSATSAGKISASLNMTSFVAFQTGSVKLTYKFPKPVKSFAFRLTWKQGSAWLLVRKGTKHGNFSGQKTATLNNFFARITIKVGTYHLDISSSGAHKLIIFKIVPFSGNLTKTSFTVAEAKSIKLTYGFSKLSKSFAYQLAVKQGSKWKVLRNVKRVKKSKRLYFRGVKTASLESLFGGKAIVVGRYRLIIACAYSSRLLKFKVVNPANPAITIGGSTGSGAGSAGTGGADFTITGGVGGLALGQTKPIGLTLTNPHSVPIFVTRLTVAVSADSTPPGCKSASNLQITQSNASSASSITVPAKASVTLTSAPRAPQITFLDLPDVNQDVCKNKSFTLTYNGSAHS